MNPRHPLGASAAATLAAERLVWFFDLDGTLVDSDTAHAAAFCAAVSELAPELLPGFSYPAHAGATTREVMATLGAEGQLIDRLARRKQERYRDAIDAGQVPAYSDAFPLLDRLAQLGRTTYLVTSGSRDSVARVLANSRLQDRFRAILTGDDLQVSKPDPAVYRIACQHWEIDPDDAVVVEDSGHGVRAALGAGLPVFQVHATRPVAGAVEVRDLAALASILDLMESGCD